jgi:hypothetical protein
MISSLRSVLFLSALAGGVCFILHTRRLFMQELVPLVIVTLILVCITVFAYKVFLLASKRIPILMQRPYPVLAGVPFYSALVAVLVSVGQSIVLYSYGKFVFSSEYERETVSFVASFLLAPSFFVVCHSLMTGLFAALGQTLKHSWACLFSLILTLPTLYMLIAYARQPTG